jgi:serine/threonine protein kinase
MTSTEKKKAISKEIEILKNISHPNIIKIIDSYHTPETVNIVMESFSNHSLATFVK